MTRDTVLKTAERVICKDRNQIYGGPEKSFSKIAEFWSAYLSHEITAQDVALMMVLFKVARICTGIPKLDNCIDMVGYAACAGELMPEETHKEEVNTHARVQESSGKLSSDDRKRTIIIGGTVRP